MIRLKQFLFMIGLLLLVSCMPQQQDEITSLSSAKVLFSSKPITSFPPPELADAFNREECADYCWRGIILGQPEEEAINLIRSDSLTDKTIQPWGDYMGIQHENGYSSISWNMLLPYESDRLADGGIEALNGFVDTFSVAIQKRFPVEWLFQSSLGLPEYVFLPMPSNHGEWSYDFYIAYPKHRVEFRAIAGNIDPNSGIPRLTSKSLVDLVRFYTEPPNYRCNTHYYEWSIMEARFRPLYFRDVPNDCE